MCCAGVRFLWSAFRYDRLAADQCRTRALGFRRDDCSFDRIGIVAVDSRNDVPAVPFEAPRCVVGEPLPHRGLFRVDRNPVVVPESDQLGEAQRAGERACFVRDPFHQAAIAGEDVSVMIDDVMAFAVELRSKHALGDRHAHCVRKALPERTRRRLDARGQTVFRMTWRFRMELTKTFELFHRKLVTREMEQRIKEHRAVPVRDHETVTIGPRGVGWVVTQMAVPQHFGDIGHSHRHAGMT